MKDTAIVRQLELVPEVRNEVLTVRRHVLWTHWRDGRITRQELPDGREEFIILAVPKDIDQETYRQLIYFKSLISNREWAIPYKEAVWRKLLAPAPLPLSERKKQY